MFRIILNTYFYIYNIIIMKTINSFISEKLKITKKMLDNQHEYVDLGLPSGTLWATCNGGAKIETECGDYFAWGETKHKMEYTWVTYEFGKVNNLTKYNDEDKLTELEPEDDAAHVNMGGEWCIPTEEQFKELKKHTKHKWFENYNDTGVNGRLITGKNGNTIFLPAGSFKSEYNNSIGKAGEYWTKNLSDYKSDGVDFQFSKELKVNTKNNSSFVHDPKIYIDKKSRYYGLLIRPVKK